MPANPSDNPVQLKVLNSCMRLLKEATASLGRPPRLGLAFSGGLDSTCLVAAWAIIQEQVSSLTPPIIYAIHINHQIRSPEELTVEASCLIHTATRFGIPLFYHELARGEVMAYAHSHKTGIEETARILRYQAFSGFMQSEKLDYLLLAHHADDQIELQLMRFFQGINEYGGNQSQREFYLRPFKELSRRDLQEFANQNQLVWHQDSSNVSNEYLRNQIRNSLVPLVETIFPGYRQALRQRAQRAHWDEEYLSELAAQFSWEAWSDSDARQSNQGLAGDCGQLLSLHPALRLRVLRFACLGLLKTGAIAQIPSFDFFEPLLKDANWTKPGIIRQGQGVQVERRSDRVLLMPLIVAAIKKGYLIRVKQAGTLTIGNLGTFTVARVQTGLPGFPLPCTIRTPFPGESLPQPIVELRRRYKDVIPAELSLVIEIQGQICGIFASPWLGNDFFTNFDTFGREPEYLGYTLMRKELGFST